MTKEIALKRHENDNNDWRKMSIKRALETAAGQRQLAEQLAPTITMHIPAMQQFFWEIQVVANAMNEAMERYREIGLYMAKAMQAYQQQADEMSRAIRLFVQPNLDAINREIAGRNAITVESSTTDADEVVTTTTIKVRRPLQWMPLPLDGSNYLCPCIAVHFSRKIVQFEHQGGWVWKNLEPLQMKILEFLWRQAKNGDTIGFSLKELGQRLAKDDGTPRASNSIGSRILDINKLGEPYGYMTLIVSNNHRRSFNRLLWNLQ